LACHLQIDANPDQDPVYHYDMDPNPESTIRFDADPDPDPQHLPQSYHLSLFSDYTAPVISFNGKKIAG
jgi:hypothetical protein